jgi:cytochrome c556
MSLKMFSFLIVMSAAALGATGARAEDQDDIDYRQHIMTTMDEQLAAIQQIVHNKAPADNFATHVQIVAVTAATAKAAFTPKVPGGRAKPEVWAKWADFSKRLDELAAAATALAKTAKEGGVQATAPKLDTLKCDGCHDVYREKEK